MKTSKQKCLEMWEWLAANPQATKQGYQYYLVSDGRRLEYQQCWACIEDSSKEGCCQSCPIDFPRNSDGIRDCFHTYSPYRIWKETTYAREWAAKEMVRLIKETWV